MTRGGDVLDAALCWFLAAALTWAMLDWQIGPEFWPAVPAMVLLGWLFWRRAWSREG